MPYWAGANAGIVFSELLTSAAQLATTGAICIFLIPRIENSHGGSGRAIAILPYEQPRKVVAEKS